MYAEEEAQLLLAEASRPEQLESMVVRRVAGEPLEQVLGWAAFAGLRLHVAPGVFVPRRRSELLATEAVALTIPSAVVVDLCCGVGALGAAITARVADVELHATDLDAVAVGCAARNLPGARTYVGDLFAPLPRELRGRVDVLVVNAPYVPTDEIALMPPEARDHEATVALDGGADGLAIHRRVATEAPAWLAPDGHLLIETSRHQADGTADAIRSVGLRTRIVRDDDLEATVVIGSR